jgi:tRNA dimethylallyltransferase
VGKAPVLVGGSALYTRAVLDRFEFPGTDPDARARWEAELAVRGAAELHALLAERDPDAATRILPDNGRRIVRALEVIELTGRPFSASLPQLEYVDPATVQIGVRIDRELLEQRIEQRVAEMFDDGLVDEVRRLLDEGLAEGRTASRAIGYQQVISHLAGELTLDEARERTVIATRQFARRQLSWWKDDPRITWIDHDAPDRVGRALAAIL